MPTHTGIEWTDSTWNPVTGCTPISSGCDNCYAKTIANRLLRSQYLGRSPAIDSRSSRHDPFAVRLWPERVSQPAEWRSPRRIFVNSMSDLFHAHVPVSFVRELFALMLTVDRHIYQILTKRPSRLERFVRNNSDLFLDGIVPPHIWLGTSVENQAAARRVDSLRRVPARTLFLSCEPLIGPLELNLAGISWVIVGGESGAKHRPMALDWVRTIRDQCIRTATPFFFKQVGGRTPKSGGRILDGRVWSQFPPLGGKARDEL
jgi:protein gp37